MFHPVTIHDSTGNSSASFLPDYGFNCISWKVSINSELVEVLDTLPGFIQGTERPSSSGIPILFPFPNRIENGVFEFNNKTYQLPKNHQQKNAIHGFVYDKPFTIIDQKDSTITCEFQLSHHAPDKLELWPCDFILTVTYMLERDKLKSIFTIKNPDSNKSLPWGLGTHTYFKLPIGNKGDARKNVILANANKCWELKENLPTGKIIDVPHHLDIRQGKPYSECKFDDLLTDIHVENGSVISKILNHESKIQLTQTTDDIFRHLVIFTPPAREAICLEPYTCITNAVNLQKTFEETNWEILPPLQSKSLNITLSIDRIN